MGKGFLRSWLSIIATISLLAAVAPGATAQGMQPGSAPLRAAAGAQSADPAAVDTQPCELVDLSLSEQLNAQAASSLRGGLNCNPVSSGTAQDSGATADDEPVSCSEVPVVQDVDRCEAWVGEYGNLDAKTDRPGGGIAVSPGGDRIYQAGTSWTHPCADVAATCGDIATVAYGADGQRLWEANYAGTTGNHEQGHDVAVSPDGSLVYVGGIQDSEGNNDTGAAVVVAYDATSGSEVWTARYDDPAGGAARAWSIAVSPDGEEVYIAGWTNRGGNSGYLTVAFGADSGTQLWDARYDGPPTVRPSGNPVMADSAIEVVVSPDGARVYVTGTSNGGTQDPGPSAWIMDFATVAYRAAPPDEPGGPGPGTELWVARFDAGDRDQQGGGMAVSPDGSRVIVTGQTDAGSNNMRSKFATVAYDAATGAEVWRRLHGRGRTSSARALAFSPTGDRVFVAGHFDDGDGFEAAGRFGVVAYDSATGTALWDAAYRPQPHTRASALGVAVSPDGETVYVAGDAFTQESPGLGVWATVPTNVATVAYDASDGVQRWVARFERPSRMFDSEWGNVNEQLFVSEDGGRLYASAHFYSPTSSYGLLAYDTGEATPTPSPTASPTGSPSPTPSQSPTQSPTPTPTPTETTTASPSPTESASASPSPSESPQPDIADVSFTDNTAESGQHSDETLFEARLADSSGDPLAGRELRFELVGNGSRTFNAITNDDGVARITPTLEEKPGPYQLTVRYDGDDEHAGDADTMSFVVEREDSALDLSETKGKDKALVAHLYDRDTPADGIAGRPINFYAGADLIGSATTGNDGVATFEAPEQKGKKPAYEARFEGDDYYVGASDVSGGKGGKGGNGGGGSGGRGAEASYAGKVLLM